MCIFSSDLIMSAIPKTFSSFRFWNCKLLPSFCVALMKGTFVTKILRGSCPANRQPHFVGELGSVTERLVLRTMRLWELVRSCCKKCWHATEL